MMECRGRRELALRLFRIANSILADFTDDFETSDTLGPDDDTTIDQNEKSLFMEDKQDVPLSSPARTRHDVPDEMRTKPELIDTIKMSRGRR